jgi:hypothetical protein
MATDGGGEVSIRLTEPSRVYFPGDTLEGEVTVASAPPVRLEVRAELVGNEEAPGASGPRTTLDASGRFSLKAPRWPTECPGVLTSIQWYLVAETTSDDGTRRSGRCTFRLLLPDDEAFVAVPLGPDGTRELVVTKRELRAPTRARPVMGALLGVMALAIFIGSVVAIMDAAISTEVLLVGSLGALLCGYTSFVLVRGASPYDRFITARDNRIAERLGAPQLALRHAHAASDGSSYRGEAEGLTIDVYVLPDAPPVDVTASLVVLASSPHPLFRREVVMRAAEPGRYSGHLSLPSPAEAPGTAVLFETWITWRVYAVVRLPDEDDWSTTLQRDLRVYPASNPEAGRGPLF